MVENSTTRLHITPLNPDLLPSVLPPSIRPSATDISFHTIPTFPENNYGYITLPTMEAEKIQKKLNGKILKGKKFRIETARPSKRSRGDEEEEEEEETSTKPRAEKKKSKKSAEPEDGVIEGYELPSDRKVKRGWTESSKKEKSHRSDKKRSKDDKKEKPQPKSKYTDKSELLFRTTLPPNRVANESDDKKSKKKKGSSRETVVHEFEKTYTQPSFLRSSGDETKPSTAFDEEKGWVDDSGEVKEAVSKKSRKDNYRPGQIPGAKEKRLSKEALRSKSKKESSPSSSESEDWTSSSGSSGESSASESDNDPSDDSSDESSGDSSDDSVMNEAPTDQEPTKETTTAKATPPTSDDSDADSEAEPTGKTDVDAKEADAKEPSSTEVHPLEALFKRSAPTATEDETAADTNAGFSFFGGGDIESEDEAGITEPQTPFTKRDLQDRGLRSAAPTPDTSLINRRLNWEEEDDMEDEDAVETPVSKSRSTKLDPKEETEFTKWFWENRGDNNRAWKKRRRDAAKEQRQRENRKKGMKGKS